jgi:3-hydroxyisobutyrate dehydrogenase-like beta-hydroxyacid dehydrogenase
LKKSIKGGVGCVVILPSKVPLSTDSLASFTGFYMRSPWMNAKVPLILGGNFKPGFRIELHIKDLQNALDTAHNLGVPLPLTAEVMEILQALLVDGQGASDHSAMVRYYEKLSKIELGNR